MCTDRGVGKGTLYQHQRRESFLELTLGEYSCSILGYYISLWGTAKGSTRIHRITKIYIGTSSTSDTNAPLETGKRRHLPLSRYTSTHLGMASRKQPFPGVFWTGKYAIDTWRISFLTAVSSLAQTKLPLAELILRPTK